MLTEMWMQLLQGLLDIICYGFHNKGLVIKNQLHSLVVEAEDFDIE